MKRLTGGVAAGMALGMLVVAGSAARAAETPV